MLFGPPSPSVSVFGGGVFLRRSWRLNEIIRAGPYSDGAGVLRNPRDVCAERRDHGRTRREDGCWQALK